MRAEFSITDLGGHRLLMTSTSWTLVRQAKGTGPAAKEAFARLCGLYWKPVYAWLRKRGLNNEDAKDAAQDFFAAALERKDLFEKCDSEKGGLRAFLFRRMRWFWIDHLRKAGRAPAASADAEQALDQLPAPDEPPDVEFTRHWARETLETARCTVADGLRAAGRELRLKVFEHRSWQGLSVAETAQRLGIDEDKVKNELRAYKHAFRETLENLVRATVATDAEADEELELILQYGAG